MAGARGAPYSDTALEAPKPPEGALYWEEAALEPTDGAPYPELAELSPEGAPYPEPAELPPEDAE